MALKPLPKQIGHLKVIKDLGYQLPQPTYKKPHRMAIFKCLCGKEFRARVDQVKRKDTKSCGCQAHRKKKSKSGPTIKFVGVRFDFSAKKFTAYLDLEKPEVTIGFFKSATDAAIMREFLIIQFNLDHVRNF